MGYTEPEGKKTAYGSPSYICAHRNTDIIYTLKSVYGEEYAAVCVSRVSPTMVPN